MTRIPRRLSLFWDANDSPLKLKHIDTNTTFEMEKGIQSKLNIKIRKRKLPKDFFGSKSKQDIRIEKLTKWNNTVKDEDFQDNQNQTPKFSQSSNKLELFRSSKTLAEIHGKILPSNTSFNQRKRFNIDKPLRQLSTGLKILRKYPSKLQISKFSRMNRLKEQEVKFKSAGDTNWQMPNKLPPLSFNQTFFKMSRKNEKILI